MGNDPDYEATQTQRRIARAAVWAARKAAASRCINCAKVRCDGHDAESWRLCAERFRARMLRAEQKTEEFYKNRPAPLPPKEAT